VIPQAPGPGSAGPAALPRSYLYVPGDAPDKLDRALGRGADALVIDLEDAVPPAGKEEARAAVLRWLREVDPGACSVWVRVNAGELRGVDVAALAGVPNLTGLVLAKLDEAAEVVAVAAALSAAGDHRTLLMPLLETARAILAASEIAGQPRVHQLQIGEVDLAADTGIDAGPDDAELTPLRAQVVLASAAAEIHPPVGPVSREFRDLTRFEESTWRLRRLGFFGRCCIHPNQLAAVHAVFTPTAAEVAEAAELVAGFDAAVAAGRGVLLDDAGRMVDLAVVRRARRTLAAASVDVGGSQSEEVPCPGR
jgi:citrate lyase subunit beta / citryl-CoA lyase